MGYMASDEAREIVIAAGTSTRRPPSPTLCFDLALVKPKTKRTWTHLIRNSPDSTERKRPLLSGSIHWKALMSIAVLPAETEAHSPRDSGIGDTGLIATGSPGRSVADAGSIPPMAADRSALLRTAIIKVFATFAMTMWLTLLLLCSAWVRPIGETARVWVCSLPLFLLLDFIRHKIAPDQVPYLAWLGSALAAARRGETYPSMAGRSARLVICYGPLALLATYIVAFIFVPAIRVPAEALDQMPAVHWAYGIVGAWYPAVVNEPAHIVALGHPQDASDLRHFMTAVLIFSIGTAFVAAGPGRREFLERWLLQRVKLPMQRLGRAPSDRRLFRIALGQALAGGSVLAVLAGFGTVDTGLRGYWRLEAFPPCLMFMLSSWLLSKGIAAVGALGSAASVEQDLLPFKSSL